MTIHDKRGLLGHLDEFPEPRLELGTGATKKWHDAISVDRLDYPAVDIVGDALEVLARIPDGCIHSIYSSHFLEHVEDLPGILRQVTRTLADGGIFEVIVPHFSNPYYFSDPTHRNFFGLYTFSYLCNEAIFARRVPIYGEPLPLEVRRVDLEFKAPRPFYVRYAAKRVFGFLVNLSRWSQEFYEENLTGTIPCYSLHFHLARLPRDLGSSAATAD